MHPKSPRSIAAQTALLSAVLVSNFGGVTGALLSLDGGKLAGALKADALFPVAGYKRCLDTQNGYGVSLQPLNGMLPAHFEDAQHQCQAVYQADKDPSLTCIPVSL